MSSRRGMGAAGTALRRPTAQDSAPSDNSLVAALAGASNEAGQVLRMVRVAEVAAHPNNPRDQLGDLTELAASIKALGLRQPILVVPASVFKAANPSTVLDEQVRWVALAGHRRRAAAESIGVEEIPAWIRSDLSGKSDAAETFIVENMHRRGFSPLEEARAMGLLADAGHSQRQIAERSGFSQAHVSKRLSLLRLPQPVQDALTREELTVGDALAITAVPVDEQLAVYELAVREKVPVTSAVHVHERERGEQANRDKARRRAEREKLPFVEQPAVEFKGNPWAHRLESKTEVAAAKEAGTLLAGVDTGGGFVYYSRTSRKAAGNEDERERRAANKARGAAAAQLVSRKPSAREVADTLVDAVLHDRVPYSEALRLAHQWLGDSVGISGTDMQRWLASVAELDGATRAWVAWTMTVAGAEARMRWRHRRWDADDRAYLDRLASKVGYVPTAWEKEQLARGESDSDGITAGEEAD